MRCFEIICIYRSKDNSENLVHNNDTIARNKGFHLNSLQMFVWLQERHFGSSLAFNKVVSEDCLLILSANVIGTGHIIERNL